MIKLNGLHLLLTYQCTHECDHCFVWGSPYQSGVMNLEFIREVLRQAQDLGTVEWIYFEGGEPFLYNPVMLRAIQESVALGFKAGIVSNGYWAIGQEDALVALQPLAGLVEDLSVSSDLFHWGEDMQRIHSNLVWAAERAHLPLGTISIEQPEEVCAEKAVGQIPAGGSGVMYRGRAVEKLAPRVPHHPWDSFVECPHEELRNPGRVHIDPFGNLHICQGLLLGNLLHTPLSEICAAYDPDAHPIIGTLLRGGPAELARQSGLPHAEAYADACHLCYATRLALRGSYPVLLAPDQVYGIF
jgi:hypothetical protein